MPKKKIVEEALEAAKKLEEQHVPTDEEVLETYRDGMSEAEKLRGMLKPSWFVKDTDSKKRKKAR